MKETYKKFYDEFCSNTGYIPTAPMHLNVYPGDFFQIRNGKMVILGNIYNDKIIDVVDDSIKKDSSHSTLNWNFSNDVTKPYSGRGTGFNDDEEFEFCKQTLAFHSKGSYSFKGNNPKSVKISNWDVIQESLIIKLTQGLYSFREVYVITETTTTSDWTLAIAGSKKAKLTVASDKANFEIVDVFGHSSSKSIKSKNIEFYHHESRRKPIFFKAKKLAVKEEKRTSIISNFTSKRENDNLWVNSFFDYELNDDDTVTIPRFSNYNQLDLLDLLQANQLNPNTALSYFKWVKVDSSDINKFF